MAQTKTQNGAQNGAKDGAATATAESAAPAETKPRRRRITRRKAVEERVRSYFDALARHDVRAMAEHWSPNVVGDLVPIGVLRGPAELESFFRETFAAVPDLDFTVTRLVAGESEAAVEWRLSGSFTGGPFQGIEPTGRPVELRGLDFVELEDGMIVTNTAYYDGAEFARQVGMLPPQDSGAERAMKGAFNAATRVRRAVAGRGAGR
ncbi:MAG: ester cyclase [Thermoleophilaceae bacterium]